VNKTLLTLYISLIITARSFAQLPAYTATVYDTTVTGYYFLSPSVTPFSCLNLIMDAKGHIVYYKYFSSLSVDFKLQPNGQMTYNLGTKFYVMDSTFFIKDTIVAANGYQTNLHELIILPDGHYLLLATENVTMDLSAYHYFLDNGTAGSQTASVRCNIIQELDENENLVFEWHLKDHISFDSVDPYWLYNPSIVDWSHSNAVVKDNDGNYLLSLRHQNQIIKVNGTTGAIMWRFGGNYNQFTFLNDTIPFYGQHGLRVLDNGNIVMFDNGNHTVPHGARALEYQLDENNLTAQLIWSYTYDSAMYSNAMGNVQYLENLNRVIDYGDPNTARNVCFNVVRQDKSKVFELSFHDTLNSYRTFYYDHLPWSLNRPQITCYDSSGSHYLDAGPGYAAYSWSNGSTTRIIQITSADTFAVFVPYGQGGVISSEDFIVSDTSNPCALATSVDDRNNPEGFNLYPTPAKNNVTIFFPQSHSVKEEIIVRDVSGRIVLTTNSGSSQKLSLNISQLAEGMYFLTASGKTLKFIKEN
jgi:hypothetical protein